MFLKLRPENIFIQNCTNSSRIDIYNMNENKQDFKRRKRKPGKRRVVMFVTKQMQTELSLTSFQLMKVCGDSRLHLFEQKAKNYEGFHAKIAGIKEVRGSFYSSVSYSWMSHNASGFCLHMFLCNSLQIFIFHCTYFFTADVFFLPPHLLAVSILAPCN